MEPSKLPTPAEWVNVRRVRVKDAVNSVWWLSPHLGPRHATGGFWPLQRLDEGPW